MLTKLNITLSEEDRSALRELSMKEHRSQSNMVVYLINKYVLESNDIYLQRLKNEIIQRQTKEKEELDKKLEFMVKHQQEKDKELQTIIQQQQEKKLEQQTAKPEEILMQKEIETPINQQKPIITPKEITKLEELLQKAKEVRKQEPISI